ncbi:MAG: hypothetical protein QOI46_807 [Alphaproteobacteria bacterium]|nr:hypothetical protein [Alphaproteobacteria bacterium]
MSYLNPTRVHFAGQFRADVSTVNNDDQHFDSAAFTLDDQKYGDDNGWWQPSGTGAWRLCGCVITAAAWDGKFATTGAGDPVVGLQLKNSSDRVDAKLVDLDPDQQMVSTIFGLEVRIADPVSGAVLMTGQFSPAPFMDIWSRGGEGDTGASVFYQSTLVDVVWGDLSASPALRALQAATIQRQLSMRFMVDSYNMGGDKRGYGRIVGTIGPALAGDPVHFVAGRHLASTGSNLGNVTCCLDPKATHILADFGNALMNDANGNVPDSGDIHLVAVKNGAAHLSAADVVDLGSLVGYAAPGYYEQTAGIQAFPPNGSLTAQQLQALQTLPLAAVQSDGAGGWNVLSEEAPDGIYARADMFVCRMNPGESRTLPIQVTQFGQPLAGQTIVATISSKRIGRSQGGSFAVSTPVTALQLQFSGPTGVDGWTSLTITGGDPGRPRRYPGGQYLDGQVYEIDLAVVNAANAGTEFNPWLFISVLLFSETAVPGTVTWNGDVLPILQQYANLYPRPHGPVVNYDPKYPDEPNPTPLLHPVISLTNKDWVGSFAPRILTALGLPIEHPNHMPVTRDLSAGRRGILQKWMQQVIAGSIPLEPGPVIASDAVPEARREAPPAAAARDRPEIPDSKTAAMRRIKSGAARGTK